MGGIVSIIASWLTQGQKSITTRGTMAVTQVAVTTTAALAVAANPNRRELRMTNLDATNQVFWGSDVNVAATATPNSGYPLLPKVEYVNEWYTGPVYVVGAGTADLRILEQG